MNQAEIIEQRLRNQGLYQSQFKSPVEVVSHFGAVQSQDYGGALWALGSRTRGFSESKMEASFNTGEFLRTHVMRPTWHFVSPQDIRWLLMLTAPRVHAATAFMYRQTEVDEKILKKTDALLEKSLRDKNFLTRDEIAEVFRKAGIQADNLRVTHLIIHAELDGLICSGPRKGKQFTYALLEERVPQVKALKRDEALVALTRKYFSAHGPATLKDFVWWSGLTMADAKKGIAEIAHALEQVKFKDEEYFFLPSPAKAAKDASAYLLPNYDEFTVGYTDRTMIHNSAHDGKLDSRGSVIAQNCILLNGQIVGTWKRTLKKNQVEIELTPFYTIGKREKDSVVSAAQEFAAYINLTSTITWK